MSISGGSSSSSTNYPICHMKTPMVQCVKLNLSNGNIHKTDLQCDYKTEVCLKKTDSNQEVKLIDNEKALVLPNLQEIEDNQKTSGKDDQTALVPDSTTSQLDMNYSFNCGDDVFVQHKDGRYYLGTVISVESGGRWLVRFGDDTQKLASAKELRPLSSPGGTDAPAMCVICKSSKGNGDEVIACDKCSRGYHPSCHNPPVVTWKKGMAWNCKRCVTQRKKAVAVKIVKNKNKQKSSVGLPYDLSSLCWDSEHRTNSENIYCYCGADGSWFAQMLQCARCKQWFHQNCIPCLKYPLYTGDRFYVFVCSLCNFGTEFLRRLEMKWVDLVHLVLFNLTTYHSKKYFDLDTIVIPYTMDNWYALQLPQKMYSTNAVERRELILSALSNNENRFKCGREIKRRTTIWGLRSRTPPPPPSPPTAPLPRGPLTDQALSGRWGQLTFVPYPKKMIVSHDSNVQKMIVPADSHWQSLMMGKNFQTCSSSDVESLRSTPSPMLSDVPSGYQFSNEFSNRSTYINQKSRDEIDSDYHPNKGITLVDRDIKPFKQKEYKLYEMDYQGGGFVKKSLPFPKLALSKRQKNDISKQKSKRWKDNLSLADQDNNELMNRTRRKLKKSLSKQKQKNFKETNSNLLDEENSFMSTDHDGASKDSSVAFDTIRSNDILPLTPPTSMSAPPTPPTTIMPNSNSNSSDISTEYQISHSLYGKDSISYDSDNDQADFKISKCNNKLFPDDVRQLKNLEKSPKSTEKSLSNGDADNFNQTHNLKITAINLEISKLSTKNIIEHSKIMSLHHIKTDVTCGNSIPNKPENDSSGDDTSSRGTLDSIIPPPVNFQGVNNPFHNVNNSLLDQGKFSSITNKLFNRHRINKQNLNSNLGKQSNLNKCQRISLPVNLNPVIQPGVKLLKRQLSEKDLIIKPNGEVKRRRHRRTKIANIFKNKFVNNKNGLNERQKSLRSSICQEDVTRSGEFSVNEMSSQVSRGSVTSRCLRQRQDKNYNDGRRGSTSSNNANGSQIISSNGSFTNMQSKVEGNMNSHRLRNLNSPHGNDQWNALDDMQDLKSSVHIYFGAANRIAAGEKFTLAGKRITDSGKFQYLIEWEGHGS